MNAPPDSARPSSRIAFFLFGRALPASIFFFLVGLQIQQLRPELATAYASLPSIDAVTFLVNRVFYLGFVTGLALIYVARRPPASARHDPVAFLVSMYASFVLLAYRPLTALFSIKIDLNPDPVGLLVSNMLIILGVGISVYSLAYLRFNFSIMPEARRMVSDGPYRVVRHPIYLGEILSGAGLVVALPGLTSLIVLVTFIGAQLYRTGIEEAVLAKAIPGYEEYMRRTRHRLIPGVL